MTADDVRAVLLVRAVEESGGAAALLSDRERTEAGRAAAGSDLSPEQAVVVRARRLAGRLTERLPGMRYLTRAGSTVGIVTAAFVLVSLALGAGVDLLGGKQVHLLQGPLILIIAFNLVLFLVLLLRSVFTLESHLFDWAAGLFSRLTLRWERVRAAASLEVEVTNRFAGLWLDSARPLLWAWASRALHLGALAFVAGAVGAMYLRGVASEFRITWESTFLVAAQVQAVLSVVLAPGLAFLGWPMEPVATLQAPASGPAAHWIHLYAITAAVLVALPRLILAGVAHLRARRLTDDLPLSLSNAYYVRLRAPFGGAAIVVRVVGYSHTLEARTRDQLGALVRSLYGERARIESFEQVAYGDELAVSDATALVLVFSLAQTPEPEVHGAWASEAVGGATHPLVLVDAATFVARLAGDPELEERRSERRRAWTRILADAGVGAVHLDLSARIDDATLEAGAEAIAAAQEGSR